MVDFQDWEQYYTQILHSFRFSRKQDEESARLLYKLLPEPRLEISTFWQLLQGKTVFIFGAHENVEKGIDLLDDSRIRGVFIAADGACSALRNKGIRPDLIVTDLDGKEEDLLHWNSEGVPLIVHAHGDNMERIRSIAPSLRNCLGTTQSRPFGNIHNFGGFTDGDRCVFLADHFAAIRIILVGFDFTEVGKYSFHSDEEQKLRKLGWAKKLISLFEVDYL